MGNRVISFILFFAFYASVSYFQYYEDIKSNLSNHAIDTFQFYFIIIILMAHAVIFGGAGVCFYEFIIRGLKQLKENKINFSTHAVLCLAQGVILVFASLTVWMALDHNAQNEFYKNPENLFLISGIWFIVANIALTLFYIFIKSIRILFKK